MDWLIIADPLIRSFKRLWIILLVYCAEMEDENRLYAVADVHGDIQGQTSQYSETTHLLQQQQQQQQPNLSQGYPVHPSNMAEMPYYAPGVGYAGGYGAPIASLPQQQVPVVFSSSHRVSWAQSFIPALSSGSATSRSAWQVLSWPVSNLRFNLSTSSATINFDKTCTPYVWLFNRKSWKCFSQHWLHRIRIY